MSSRIYFDNNATTQLHPSVLSALEETLRDVYGNASSIHKEGQTARRVIEEARESVASLVAASAREIVFTSGGTESNNAAILGALSGPGRRHIVTTTIEHPSVAETAVVGMPDQRRGEIPVAFVRLNAGASLDGDALAAHCRERIAAYKTPERWIAVEEWPLTGPGKIQKFVLRDRLIAGEYA